MRFEAEEVKAVALGTGWVAAVTNLNFLRIFTEGGLQVSNSYKKWIFIDNIQKYSSIKDLGVLSVATK